jgi:hypothetical protein
MPKNERKAGEARCTKCKRYYPKSELSKHGGGRFCGGCIAGLGRGDGTVPRESGVLEAVATIAALSVMTRKARKPKIEVSGEAKLDLSDE